MAVLNDKRLSSDAKVMFGVILDCERGRIAVIGYTRLTERLGEIDALGIFRKAARRRILAASQQLEGAGHVRNLETKRGKPARYQVLTSSNAETTTNSSGDASRLPKDELPETERLANRKRLRDLITNGASRQVA